METMKKYVKFLLLLVASLIWKESYSQNWSYEVTVPLGGTLSVRLSDFFKTEDDAVLLWKQAAPGAEYIFVTRLERVQVYMQGYMVGSDAGLYIFQGKDYNGKMQYLEVTVNVSYPKNLKSSISRLKYVSNIGFALKPRELWLG